MADARDDVYAAKIIVENDPIANAEEDIEPSELRTPEIPSPANPVDGQTADPLVFNHGDFQFAKSH